MIDVTLLINNYQYRNGLSVDLRSQLNFIFLGKNDNFLITCELNKNIKKACKELGIKKNLSTHDCRRYSATQCAIKGMSEPALQVMHGWTDRDTARHYINSAAAQGEQKDIMINVLN